MSDADIWLVAVTAGRWQRHGMQEARRAGLKLIAFDGDPEAEGFADADLALCVDPSDRAKVSAAVRALGKNVRGAVGFCSEIGVSCAAHLREALELPGPRSELCRRLLDKATQRRIWTDNGVPGPRWLVVRSPAEALGALRGFGFPLIIKPTDSSGSRGVTKLESAADDVEDAVARAFRFSSSGEVLLEGYMEGTEFTVEVFGDQGRIHVLAVTEKKKVAGTRGTVARELATPERPREVLDRISSVVTAAFGALGYTEGPGHAEVILQDDGVVGMVEVAGRGGGFMVFDRLVPAVSGVNIARLTALQAVGLPCGPIEKRSHAAVLRFFPSRPGMLRSISGMDAARRIDGVECGAFVSPGDRFNAAAADGDRLGYILSSAPTPGAAQELADAAERLIHFQIDEEPQ